MTRFATTDAYRQALASLRHTPVRFLNAAIGEVARQYGLSPTDVRQDLFAGMMAEQPPEVPE